MNEALCHLISEITVINRKRKKKHEYVYRQDIYQSLTTRTSIVFFFPPKLIRLACPAPLGPRVASASLDVARHDASPYAIQATGPCITPLLSSLCVLPSRRTMEN